MINFFTILTKQSGMGNYFRMYEIYKILLEVVPVRFYLYTDQNFDKFIAYDVVKLKEGQTVNLPKCDLLIHDFPFIDRTLNQFFQMNTISKTVGLNDATVNALRPNIYFNTDNIVKVPVETAKYVGLEYQIIRNDLIRKNKIPNKIRKIGIMFGGSDPGNLNEPFLYQLIKEEIFKNYEIKFVVSKDVYDRLNRVILPPNIDLLMSPNIIEFYLEIDLLINMGGMSTYEAMYVGVPVFAIEWNYMSPYVRQLDTYRLIRNLGGIDEGCKALQNNLKKEYSEDLTKMILKAQNILDGKGAERIANKILEFLGERNENRNYNSSKDGIQQITW